MNNNIRCKVSTYRNNIFFIINVLPLIWFYKKIEEIANQFALAPELGITPEMIRSLFMSVMWITLLSCIVIYVVWFFINYKKVYEFQKDAFMYKRGILEEKIEYIDYKKIKKIIVSKPILGRFFGVENIEIISEDVTYPRLKIKYIHGYSSNEKEILKRIERSKGVELTEKGKKIANILS